MPITTPDDLDKISQEIKNVIHLRKGMARARILVHMGTCGIAAGARNIMAALMKEIEKRKIKDVLLTTSSCAGLCSREPMITIEMKDEPPVKYVDLTPEKIKEILDKHISGGKIVTEYALSVGSERVL
ncbi:MAG TPA: (2Fe-2S) ferredoxin domain-containing protein [Spirochaetes bacterium]|nr:(2Fe-2S) ferredoxin domain-containing protein [Spirochaetota bacterium]